VDAEIDSLQDEQEKLKEALREYQSRVENAPGREQEYQVLARNYATTTLYESPQAAFSGPVSGAWWHLEHRALPHLDAAIVPRAGRAEPNAAAPDWSGPRARAAGLRRRGERMSFHNGDLRAFTRVAVRSTRAPSRTDAAA
jgi:hypothetical protein